MATRTYDERGAAAIFVMLLAVALLVGAGLVVDGGYALASRRTLTTQAEQAARIAADVLSEASLRDGGRPKLDPTRARAAANSYLTSVGAPPATITISGDSVTISLVSTQSTVILSVVGITSIPVAGAGTARSIAADTTNCAPEGTS